MKGSRMIHAGNIVFNTSTTFSEEFYSCFTGSSGLPEASVSAGNAALLCSSLHLNPSLIKGLNTFPFKAPAPRFALRLNTLGAPTILIILGAAMTINPLPELLTFAFRRSDSPRLLDSLGCYSPWLLLQDLLKLPKELEESDSTMLLRMSEEKVDTVGWGEKRDRYRKVSGARPSIETSTNSEC